MSVRQYITLTVALMLVPIVFLPWAGSVYGKASHEGWPTNRCDYRVAPDDDTVREAAAKLAGAARPMIIIGDGVAFSGAQAELVRVAELLRESAGRSLSASVALTLISNTPSP